MHICWEGLKVKFFKYHHQCCKLMQTQLNKLASHHAAFLLRPQSKVSFTKLNICIIETVGRENWHTHRDKVSKRKVGAGLENSLGMFPQPASATRSLTVPSQEHKGAARVVACVSWPSRVLQILSWGLRSRDLGSDGWLGWPQRDCWQCLVEVPRLSALPEVLSVPRWCETFQRKACLV